MLFHTCFDWFKKLRLFSYVLNLKIDVVLKASRVVVIRRFSLNEAPLGLFKFISDYLPYFEKINIFFKSIAKNVWRGLHGVYNLIELFLHEPNKNCDQSLNVIFACGKHLHYFINLLRGEECDHKTSFTPPLFIEVSVPIHESERSFHFISTYKKNLQKI